MAYDIVSDQRRTRIANTLNSYGERIQYSVFVVDGRAAQFVRLKATLLAAIDRDTDSLLFCDLGPLNGIGPTRFERIGATPDLWSDQPPIA